MQNDLPEHNLMIDTYLQEIYILSSEIIRIFDEIESIVNRTNLGTKGVKYVKDNPDKYFFIQPEVFTRIATIQVHSANIKKILFAAPRKKDEAKYKYDYRINRVIELQKYFDMNRIHEIKNARTRNSLEHYDERLDNISLRLWNGSIDKKYHIIATNIITSKEEALFGNPYYLNCYVLDSKIYKNAEEESNIGNLATEAKYLFNVISNELNITKQTGSIVPISDNLA
ncbi:hypothetical protein JHE06_05460 [Carnobacterium sp. CS13]|uniref:hypothetical protein n=1 Tax=Carnobacterium sp. CS13 TaxID=2800128 RepID=UPI0019121D4C|nr:hypothetical protein [Carnobacterium sp. CS13]QQP71218.1 hypothetical protein JHE06_05460 [Carnobacterium sp. CS13]